MKRSLSLLLALVLVLLCGCTRPETLRVAMSPDFAPMEFVDATKNGQDRFVGFDVSLAEYLAQGLGMELELVPMSLQACQDAVAEGTVDLSISGFSWMPDRAARFNLSDPYHAGDNSARQVLVTTADKSGSFGTAVNLRSCRIGVQTASLQEWLVREQLPGAKAVPFDDIDSGVALLKSGDLDALALAEGNADALICADDMLCKTGFCFELTEVLLDNLILLQKGNDELTESVNALLRNAAEAGYYEQWYAEALEKAGVGVEIHYDDEGNIATEGT